MHMGVIQEVSSLKALNFLQKEKTNIFLKNSKIVFTEYLLCQAGSINHCMYTISFNSHNEEMLSLSVCLLLNRFLTSWGLVVSKLGAVYVHEEVECLLWLGILTAAGNRSSKIEPSSSRGIAACDPLLLGRMSCVNEQFWPTI